MGKYDEMSVVRTLSKNPDVKITNKGNLKVVEIVKGSQYCGNSTLGKIDFLINYCGYTRCFIDIDARIAATRAKKDTKLQAIKDDKNTKNKITLNGEKLDVRKIMKMKL